MPEDHESFGISVFARFQRLKRKEYCTIPGLILPFAILKCLALPILACSRLVALARLSIGLMPSARLDHVQPQTHTDPHTQAM